MKKIQLLSILSNVCLLIGIAVASDICAMEQLIKENKPLPSKSMVEFVQSFPSMTFDDGHKNWLRLSQDARDMITAAEEKRNKNKTNLIFDIVRFLPLEVCSNIIRLFCANDKAKITFVSGFSIKDFAKLAWAQEVYDCKRCKTFNKCLIRHEDYWDCNSYHPVKCHRQRDKPISIETIFKFAGSVWLIDHHYRNHSTLSLESIKLLDKFFSYVESHDWKPSLTDFLRAQKQYRYYKTYTLGNFVAAFNKRFYANRYLTSSDMFWMKIFSTAIVSCLLSRLVALNYCQKVISPKIVLNNEKCSKLNEIINQSEFSELLSDFLQPIQDPMIYSESHNWKMLLPSLLPIPILYQQYPEESLEGRFVISGIGGFFASVCCGLLNFISHNWINDAVLFSGSFMCVSLMAWYIIIPTLMQMRQLRSKKISWDNVSDLLKKHNDGHIVIE